MTQSTFLVARENNLPQTVKEFYTKEDSQNLFKYHYVLWNFDRFSYMISNLLNKIEKQHSKYMLIKTEIKEETNVEIKVETNTNDNKSTLENNNKIGKLIEYINENENKNIDNN